MFVRNQLKLDPTAGQGGGGGGEPQGQGQGDQAGDFVRLSRSEYEALQASHNQVSKERQTMGARLESLETLYRSEKVNATLGDVLAGQQFVSDEARNQARQLLASRAEVREVNGQTTVVDRVTGKPLTEAAREALSSADFAHFLKASTQGGSGAVDKGGQWSGQNRGPRSIEELNQNAAQMLDKQRFKTPTEILLGRIGLGR